jgi:alpha-beta hydrolase superfamily lysophospholipase
MGGLVSFKVALERNDLRAVALLAPAFGRGLLGEAAKSAARISAPVLVMVEQSDNPPLLRGVDMLERTLGLRGKPFRLIRYNRGGGHELFYDVGYWWDDFKGFLHEHLKN